jgi:two-component system cell cycle sensor histidine kinase PleC
MVMAAAFVRRLNRQVGKYLSVASCILVLTFIWSFAAIDRFEERKRLIADATRETMNFAMAIEGYMTQSLNSFDEILVAARFTGISPDTRGLLRRLTEVSGLANSIYSLSLYDTDGTLVSTIADNPHSRTNVADRSWFQQFRDNADDHVFIAPPIVNRVTNQLSIILARGIRQEDGRFRGMVGMSINPEYFGQFFKRLPMGQHGVINLIGIDGVIYARVTANKISYGIPITTAGLKNTIEFARKDRVGTAYVDPNESFDHTAKYYSYRTFSNYPLIINVGLAERDVLSAFYSETYIIGITVVAFSIAMIIATIVSQRQLSIIRRQTQSLEERNQTLQRQSHALSLAMTKAEASDKIKGEFIANMSHELRTPLNAIIGFSALMLETAPHTSPERSRTSLERIHAAGRHLLDLVTGVLEMAKLESGTFEFQTEATDLCGLAADCLDITTVLREEKGLALHFDHTRVCFAVCDPARTRQAILNILSNAIKFSGAGQSLTVTIDPDDPALAVLSITDTGIGMSADEVEIAMTPFAQVSSGHAKSHGGTGLGLPLTKRLVEGQGGTLTLRSLKGFGTTVVLTFPRARQDPAPEAGPTPS